MKLKIDETLKRLLADREIKKIAKACDVSYSTLHSWVIGQTSPSGKQLPALLRIADYFNITLEELLLNEKERGTEVIMSTTFKDGETTYKLIIEKLEK